VIKATAASVTTAARRRIVLIDCPFRRGLNPAVRSP
jgi:hypothetical protein